VPEIGSSPAEPPLGLRPESERLVLARLALGVALATPGVVAAEPGALGTWVTYGDGEAVRGVVAAVHSDGRYDLTLHLVVYPEPLQELADRVRARIVEAAAIAGLTDLLGSIDIAIEDVVVPGSEAIG
jgi:hypothetical protein